MALYDDAIIDANKLREVAESAAKQQILESITPKIRQMINARILAEQEELDLDDEDNDEELEDDDAEEGGSSESFDFGSSDFEDVTPASNTMQGTPAPTTTLSTSSLGSSDKKQIVINNTGNINISENKNKNSLVLDDKLSEGLANIIKDGRISKTQASKVVAFKERFEKFKLSCKKLNENNISFKQNRKVQDIYRMLVKEAYLLRNELIKNKKGPQHLVRKLDLTIKEMREMSTKAKRNIFDFLFEGEDLESMKEVDVNELDEADDADELDEADLVLGLSGDEKKKVADASDEDGVTSALEDILSGLSFSLDTEEEEEEGDAEGEEELDVEDTEDFDVDLESGGGDDEEESLDLEEEGDDFGQSFNEADEEETFEVSESALRKELLKMKNLRESKNKRRGRRLFEDADPKADQFGGGEVVGDMFVDVDEDKLINALVDELGSVTQKPRPPTASTKKESVELRKAMKEAADYKKAAIDLRSQLVEMNLFNAKLLYANKLMQNKNLTLKQQRAIVEALDNAKTINEAKLLYKSLSGSLAKRGQSGKLSEGTTRSLGSSSRSTRSSQPVNNGVEVDRWATLAGIGK